MLKGVLFSALLLVAAVWDIRKREIPDWLSLLVLLTGFMGIRYDSFLGLVLTGLPYLIAAVLPSKTSFSMGGGDIKLMAACGFVLGVWGGVFQSIASLTLALAAGFGICALRKDKKLSTITLPLAPFFCAGGFFSYCLMLSL
jgi:leader peptidase (prepilin peptidase)/N-methyltransferase